MTKVERTSIKIAKNKLALLMRLDNKTYQQIGDRIGSVRRQWASILVGGGFRLAVKGKLGVEIKNLLLGDKSSYQYSKPYSGGSYHLNPY